MTEKLDFKKSDKAFYTGKQGRWDRLALPLMQFVMIDGQGDPNGPDYAKALASLYPVAYGIKAICKAAGQDFTVPPLEAVWYAKDPSAFVRNNRAEWRWTAMIRMPDHVMHDVFDAALTASLAKLAKKKDAATDADTMKRVRFEAVEEGDCLQTLHIGAYTDEAATLADLHDRLMPELGVTFNGPHHEIYLSDPRRTAPENLKTILRQPVKGIRDER